MCPFSSDIQPKFEFDSFTTFISKIASWFIVQLEYETSQLDIDAQLISGFCLAIFSSIDWGRPWEQCPLGSPSYNMNMSGLPQAPTAP